MAQLINGILCDEIVANFEEEFNFQDGGVARKGYLCPWNQRYTVAVGLLGYSHATSIGIGITLHTPRPYEALPYLYASSVRIEPKGQPYQAADQIAWPKCIVWAEYRSQRWSFSGIDLQGDTSQLPPPPGPFLFAEQQLSSSAEWVTVPGVFTHFAGSGKPTTSEYAFRLALVDMILTLHNTPYLPTAQVLSTAGCINSTPAFGVNPGHLMFNGCDTHKTMQSDGSQTNEVTFKFQARSQRWDYAPDPSAGVWDQVLGPDNQPFIRSIDMTTLIPSIYGY